MKIFEFDSADEMRSGAVARQVDGDGNPVNEDGTPVVTANALGGGITGGATRTCGSTQVGVLCRRRAHSADVRRV